MLTKSQIDKKFAARALTLKMEVPAPPTPGHSAAEGAVDADNGEDAKRRRRERVQHEVDPYLHEAPEVDCVDLAELGKRYRQAMDVPTGYPPLRQVSAEDFRRAPATAGHAAYSPGYETPGRPVPVPTATLAPGMVTRPLLTDGQSRPCAPGAC